MDTISKILLELFNLKGSLTIHQLTALVDIPFDTLVHYVSYLRNKNYIKIDSNHASDDLENNASLHITTPLVITVNGKIALEEVKRLSKERRNDFIRYIITTAIAVIALIISIIALN